MKRKHRREGRDQGAGGHPHREGRPGPQKTRTRPLVHRREAPAPREASPSPERPRGGPGIWLYGVHATLAAAANPHRRVHRIVLTPEAEPTLLPRLAALGEGRTPPLPGPEILPRDQVERLLPRGAVHQGIGLRADELEDHDLEDVIRAADGENGARVLVLDQVTDPHNVGAILRSAAAFDAAAVILPERHSPATTGAMAKAASGALERVPLVRVVNLARTLVRLKQAGFWCVGLDGGATASLADADLTGRLALVLGAEGEGLRRLTREHCDLMARIPIARGAESLNVSNAAAVALYEIARRG